MAVQMSIDRNKSLNGNNQSYKVNANPEKMTENITTDESHDSDKTEPKLTLVNQYTIVL